MFNSLRRSPWLVVFWCLVALCATTSPSWAKLKLTKSAPATVIKSEPITYSLTVTNKGNNKARNVVVSDTPPSNTHYIEDSASDDGAYAGNRITFHLGALPSGASRTVSYMVEVPDSAQVGAKFTSGGALATSDNADSATAGPVSTTLTSSVSASVLVPGKIVYTSRHSNDSNRQIYIINSDGSGQTELTTDQTLFHAQPALSADGSMVAFIAAENASGPYHLYVMKTEPESATNEPVQLTDSDTVGSIDPGPFSVPGWSPNGKQIIYSSQFASALITNLTPEAFDNFPVFVGSASGARDMTFSPDGRQLAYSKAPDSGGTNSIYTIGLTVDANGLVTGDNGNPVAVTTSSANQYAPTWSPDGGKIAFVQQPLATDTLGKPDLYYVNLLGGAVTRLTTNQNVFSGTIAWSPNGTNIVFNSDGPGADSEGAPTQGIDGIYTIRAVPATDQSGTNYPFRLTNLYTSYNPRYAQVSGPSGLTSSLTKDASALGSGTAAATNAVPPGAAFYYRIKYTITNSSSSPITGITIKDSVPTGTTYVSGADATEFDSLGGNRVVFNIGTVAANSTVSGTSIFQVKLKSTVAENDTIRNPGTAYFISLSGTQIYGSNDVNLFVTSTAFPALNFQKTLLKRNGTFVTSPSVSITRGDQLTYLLTISNGGFGSANNLVASDFIPNGLTATSAYFSDQNGTKLSATPPGFSATLDTSPALATFKISGLGGASAAYAIVNATVGSDVTDGTVITNTATLSATESGTLSTSQNNTVGAGTTPTPIPSGTPGVVRANFKKSVYSVNGSTSAPTGTVTSGDTILYLLKYDTVGGALGVTDATITDQAPANTRISSIYFSDANGNRIDPPTGATGDLTAADGKAIFKFPRIPNYTTGYVAVAVLVNNDAAAKATQISNTDYTFIGTGDGNGGGGGVNFHDMPAITNPLRAPLTITKKVTQVNGKSYNGTASVKPGDVLTYAITVTNPSGNGATAAKNLTITDFLPQNTTLKSAGTGTYVAASPPYVSFGVASLGVGSSSTQTFTVTVGTTAGTSVVNKDYGVQIAGLNRRFTGAAVTTPVTGGTTAALTVSKALTVAENGSTTQVAPGQTVREVLTVSNTGTTTLTNVNLVVSLPNETTYSLAYLGRPNAPTTGIAPQVALPLVTYSLGSLAAGATTYATLEVQVNYRTSANKINFGLDAVVANEASAKDAAASLTVTNKNAPTPPALGLLLEPTLLGLITENVSPGDKLVLYFTASNTNSSVAKNTVLTVKLPSISTTSGAIVPQIAGGSPGYSVANGVVSFPAANLGASNVNFLTFVVPQNAKVGTKITISDYELDADNISGVALKGKTVTLPIVAAAAPDPGVALQSIVDKSQPHTKDGRLEPPALITYKAFATNGGNAYPTSTDLVIPVPTGTNYIENSTAISGTSNAFTTFDKDSNGRVTAVHFSPIEQLAPKHTFTASINVTLSASASQSLTKIENAATLTFKRSDKTYSQTSNVDSFKVFIPSPPPAHLAVEAKRIKFGVIGQPFTTTFVVRNNGGEAAHNIILRYSLNVYHKNELYISSSDGGTAVGISQTPSTIVWDGSGSAQSGKFATLNPGDQIVVTMRTQSANDSTLKFLTGSVFDAHEKDDPNIPVGSAERNPVTRLKVEDISFFSFTTAAQISSASTVQTAGSSNIFTLLSSIFQSIGAQINAALFGSGNNNSAITKKLQSPNFNPLASIASDSAGEDFVVYTLANGDTIKIVPIVPGQSYSVEGPTSTIHGGTVVSNDGGSLIATGGGNAISVDTLGGTKTLAQLFAGVISNDGGSLRGAVLYDGGSNTLISQDGAGLISQDGAGLIGNAGGTLIGNAGGTLIAKGNLIGQDGAGIKVAQDTKLISQDGAGLDGKAVDLISQDGAGFSVNFQGNNFHGTSKG